MSLREAELVVRLGVHEDVIVPCRVEVLVFLGLDVGDLDLVDGAEPLVDQRAAVHVPELGLDHRPEVAGRVVGEVEDDEVHPLHRDYHASTDIGRFDHHGDSDLSWLLCTSAGSRGSFKTSNPAGVSPQFKSRRGICLARFSRARHPPEGRSLHWFALDYNISAGRPLLSAGPGVTWRRARERVGPTGSLAVRPISSRTAADDDSGRTDGYPDAPARHWLLPRRK